MSDTPHLLSSPAIDAATTHRRAQLASLLPLWPQELADTSLQGRQRIIRLLARALRAERCRGRDGHWAYDLCRHAALARCYREEARELALLVRRPPA